MLCGVQLQPVRSFLLVLLGYAETELVTVYVYRYVYVFLTCQPSQNISKKKQRSQGTN